MIFRGLGPTFPCSHEAHVLEGLGLLPLIPRGARDFRLSISFCISSISTCVCSSSVYEPSSSGVSSLGSGSVVVDGRWGKVSPELLDKPEGM
eukprot:8945507-Pyramimonas_sp.AAC.1